MESKGGNPFLMDDYAAQPTPQTSNPFLQDFADTSSSGGGGSENPFLNFASDQTYEPPAMSIDSTNPFASFGIESNVPDAGFGAITDTPATNIFTSQSSNIFATSDDANVDLFGTITTTTPPLTTTTSTTSSIEEKEPTPPIVSPPQQPAATPPSRNGKPPPSRPPPPRPQPPPPPVKNTKDLILSVTGAMDATSNHLLDRLQMTRTPSPTLMHSPSPTPEHSFADLLDVDSNVPDLIPDDNNKAAEPPANRDIMDLFDAPNADVIASTIFSTSMSTTGTTSLVTGIPAKQDNPFASMTEETASPVVSQAQPAFGMEYPEDAVSSEKRPSITTASPFADIETEVEKPATSVLDLVEPAPVVQPASAAADLFQGWLKKISPFL